uniref:FBD domain-containing protein n=1 Tax=Quercus lobata TaxID=97700 RepID=A0A7N2L7M6_QUELO
MRILAAGNIPDRLPTTLEFLNSLVLSEICFGNLREVSCALCLLIRSSPNLQKLKVELYCSTTVDDAVVEFLEAQDFSDISLKKLREVEMLTFDDSKPEMEFVKLLLVKSPLLKTMHIRLKRGDSTSGFKILKEVIQFQRASSTAAIICSGPDEEILIKPVNEVQQWCFGMLKDLNDAADSTSSSPAMLKFGHKELLSGEFLDLMVLRMNSLQKMLELISFLGTFRDKDKAKEEIVALSLEFRPS